MSEPADNPSEPKLPSVEGDTGDHSPSKEPTRIVPLRHRVSDLNDTIVLEQLRLEPGIREGSLGRMGTYEVLDILGRGGMGVVLRAFDEALHRDVAIKVISPVMLATRNARDRFLREARAAGSINHSNVMVVYAVGEHADFPYLVMEFVDGQSLQQRIKTGIPFSELDVVKISLQIASGLEAAHQHHIIHRDIKPGNVMLEDRTDRVKITDFGLARATYETSELTTDGGIVGTPSFMSPEQVLGQPLDHRSDLFSLGCVIYAMFAGHSPFRSESPIASATKVQGETHSSLRKTCPEAPGYMVDIVDRLLEKQPQDRYQSAQEVVAILSSRLAKLSQADFDETQAWMQEQRTVSPGKHPRRIAWWTILVASFLVVASILRFVLWPANGGPRDVAAGVTPNDPKHVATSGKLTVAATGSAQFRTLRQALDQATPGCTIEVTDSGTYTGPFLIGDPKKFKGVKLIATGKPILNVPGHVTCFTIAGVENFRLQGFRFETGTGQHGIEITGPCPGTTITNCEFRALHPRDEDRAPIHLRDGAAGTAEAPLVIRQCRIQGGGIGIVLGAVDDKQPVAFTRIEECFIQGEGRDFGVGIALQTAANNIVIRRNILRSGACGFSFVFNQPDSAQNMVISDNTLDQLELAVRLNESSPQQTIKLQSNLVIASRGISSDKWQLTEFRGWFIGNWWESDADCNESLVKTVADLQSGVPLLSRDPNHPDYLKPGPNAAPTMPGRYRSESGNTLRP